MGMFEGICTVYNRYREGSADKYQLTVLLEVHLESSQGAMLKKSGVSADNGITVIIPKTVNSGTSLYTNPLEWNRLADKTGYWTLQDGDKIVNGVADHEITKTAAELLKQYPGVYTITAVDDNDFGSLAHWEVTAK